MAFRYTIFIPENLEMSNFECRFQILKVIIIFVNSFISGNETIKIYEKNSFSKLNIF